ncbi:alpha/beta hydrolase family protein [Pseudomonas nitroreducens]|uniref:alpha/beta hydrolase family protein n=1 Tax=Pseudomonas nitroreducens TaxID=46680 RepID=UPI0009FC8EE9|nr:alpha/beta fold hydrolase [Pseudomonas nitroreducens]MCJ1878390.1 alpha/beta fold hydrolase [Pseudomonas nitroreducens]MCJ1894763.1 alpha/beta fold hydrolase [Pseudomonas nitroreducens]NMZ59296.1 alpha/beta fold hydrolase [Pseudomonas nitroreducens]SNS78555.1 Predicted dienelactone hydrolase [Pseudomonas nitroreducens]
MARRLLWVLLLVTFGTAVSTSSWASSGWGVGFHRLQVSDPLDQQPMKAIAFYPTRAAEQPLHLGNFILDVAYEGKTANGRFPLLVMSHGNYGTPLAHRDLIEALVRKGFVVVTLLHPGDNLHDHSRLGALSNLYGRPLQVSETISAALLDPQIAAIVDPRKVGVIGYSAGGETALILAGAQPRLERLIKYCQQRPDDRDACSEKGEVRADRSDLVPMADPRVGALLLLAPLSLMYGAHELEDVQVPVLLYTGNDDHILDWKKNAAALARKLPQQADLRVLDGAGHFVFMSPCSEEEKEATPDLCTDTQGLDRQAIHRDLVASAAEFFDVSLGSATMQTSGR